MDGGGARMSSRLLAVVISGLFVVAFPTAASADYAPQVGQLQVSATTVCVNAPVDVLGDGFVPNSTVTAKVNGTPTDTPVANSVGEVRLTKRFDTAGTYVISLAGNANAPRGATRTLSLSVTVNDCTEVLGEKNGQGSGGTAVEGNQAGNLPHTGANAIGTPIIAASGLILAGTLLLLLGTRRRRHRH
jgi:LPXTG-motif cell wall-anchored protein